VLDADALLTFLNDAPGAENVQEALEGGCVMSAVALSEVLARVKEQGVRPDKLLERLEFEGLLHQTLEIVPFTFEDVRATAGLEGDVLAKAASLALSRRLNSNPWCEVGPCQAVLLVCITIGIK
jgi:PIN domain nuclease of toxin-antitoxin system